VTTQPVERRWLTGTDPLALLRARHPVHTLESIEPQVRQSRMYLIACARRVWDRLPGVSRTLVALAEGYADARRGEPFPEEVALIAARLMHGAGAADDLRDAEGDLNRYLLENGEERRTPDPRPDPLPRSDEWRGLAALVYLPFDTYTPSFGLVPRPLHNVHLIREVYGNPYRHITFDPGWRTSTAVVLARTMYESREFSGMPILADALQDAGCDNEDILNHCRDRNQAHARGCWVLDMVLNLR
jgi:hypothetical protein